MREEKDLPINIEILPEEEKKELLSYYEYLLTKYRKKRRETIKNTLNSRRETA